MNLHTVVGITQVPFVALGPLRLGAPRVKASNGLSDRLGLRVNEEAIIGARDLGLADPDTQEHGRNDQARTPA